MPRHLLFILVLGCSGTSTPAPTPPAVPPPPAPDAAPAAAEPTGAARGAACSEATACAADLMCLPTPGGYCGSFCGLAGTPCDGACVATARAGEVCMQRCEQDADCRTAEGYLCDPQWKACSLPNLAAIVPRACPAPSGPARDPAFGPSTQHSTAKLPGLYQLEPSGVIANDGSVVALYISRGKMQDGNRLGLLRTGKEPLDASPSKDGRAAHPEGARSSVDRVFDASDRASYFDPWLARDAAGTIYAVWLGFDTQVKNQQIGFATSRDGGATWSEPVSVHDPADCTDGTPDCLDKPMIAVGPGPGRKGTAIYVMYAAGDGLRVRTSLDGGKTFGAAVTALAGIYGNATVGADGRLHLVTLNGGPGSGPFGSASHAVEYTTSSDGGRSFAKPIAVSRSGETLPFFFSNPGVAVDTRRKWLYVVYTRGGRDAVWDLVVAASKDGGKTWRRQRIGDDPGCAIHMVPNVALDPTTGKLHVAWYDSRGGGRFAHGVCTPGAAKCTQLGAINDRPFATLSTVRHGAAWIGEYEVLLIDDRRRTLHAVWAQPVDEDGVAVSRMFSASAKLPRR